MKRPHKVMGAVTALAMMLAGCGSSDSSSQGASFMETCKEMVTETAPNEVYVATSGVTYPKFEKKTYYSQTAGRDTPVNVLLPDNYSPDKKYPVLYILHGYWDNEDWMTKPVVHVSSMLNNLIKLGEAKEMIVVCPYIYCSKTQEKCTAMDGPNTAAYDNFVNDLLTDLMPFIEKNYPVATGRENTAITGFSMGGKEALQIGFEHPDLFGYIGGVCPAPGLNNSLFTGLNEKFGENKPRVILMSASEADTVVGKVPFGYEDQLNSNGIEHIFHKMTKAQHNQTSVIPHLYNFFRMLFK